MKRLFFKAIFILSLSLVSCKKDGKPEDVSPIDTTEEVIDTAEINNDTLSVDEDTNLSANSAETTKELETSWTLLTKHIAGDYVIFDECRYGPQALVFEDNFEWFEIKGGGDAINNDIIDIKFNEDSITINYSNVGEKNTLIISDIDEEKALFTFDDRSAYYTNQKNLKNFRVYKEECDE